ncbi:antichymotrypsin-2 isoform X2 [Dendroctonus ponderosae]|uniref:antichymotrypsin-2 isoform X2 n=1 Tax=Dendroctonus ponderosae TaxID=77166 RepID=UPI002035AEA9|nr:antichymotrypsin-2 isoform X2 [Dendroctonus ponderosae]
MKERTTCQIAHIADGQPSHRLLASGTICILSFLALLPVIMGGREELQAVIEGNGHFTKKLYNVLAQKEGNVFFSPISAHAVLAMAYQGSKGTTHEAFGKVLGFSGHLQAAEGYSDVLSHLNNVPNVQLLMANKIFVAEDASLKPTFQEITAKKFLSEVQPVNFGNNNATAKLINGWVEDKTQNKIKDLISPDSLNSATRLVLVNAIYFKGTWASKFDKSLTVTDKFYLNDVDSIDVQMMNNKGKYFFKEDEALDAKVLELPYSNPEVSLIVILPNKRNGIAQLEEKLANTDLSKITENMYKPEVVVKLPKFKIEATIQMNEVLEKVGLGVIFSQGEANFSDMLTGSEPLYVSEVIQKAFIEVNEEGTEAAAATGLLRSRRAIHMPETFEANKPFLFALSYGERLERKDANKGVLFIGKMLKPSVGLQTPHDEL